VFGFYNGDKVVCGELGEAEKRVKDGNIKLKKSDGACCVKRGTTSNVLTF
jgi:hypothetical protein